MAHKAFVLNPNYDVHGHPIRSIFGHRATSGDIGIEIECEGNKFQKQHLPAPWKYTHDGSLRGADNAEYVFDGPQKFDDVPAAIEKLWAMFSSYGTVLDDSNRTSVHVHLNVQNFFLNRLCAFFGLYVAVEEVLTAWCGEHRVGNLFCLRAKDAPSIVTKIKRLLVNDGRSDITEGMHYSGMNVHALLKFGSIEIRSLRGVTDPSLILSWVAVLRRIYELSAEYEDPRLVTENFSGGGPIEFLRMVLGDQFDVVRNGVDMTDNELRSSLYDGIRLAQDLCYCRDWSRYKPVDMSKDPFGRNSRKKTPSDILAMYGSATNTPLGGNAFVIGAQDVWLDSFTTTSPNQAASAPELEEDYEEVPDWAHDDEEDEDF